MVWDQNCWNQSSGRAIGARRSKNLKYVFEFSFSRSLSSKEMLIEADKSVTAEALKKLLAGQGETKKMVLEIFSDHNRKMKLSHKFIL